MSQNQVELKIDADGVVGIDASVVNGKKDLGFRKLIVSHVENATTLYAYTEDDSNQVTFNCTRKLHINVLPCYLELYVDFGPFSFHSWQPFTAKFKQLWTMLAMRVRYRLVS